VEETFMKSNQLLKQYIQSIVKIPRVSIEEEVELSRKIRSGDAAAKEKLIQANLRLVVKISMKITRGGNNLMDVIQNGNMGLIKSADKFDPEMGVRFSTYSAFWIKQSILRGFIKPSLNVTISYRKDEVNKKIKRHIRDFYQREGVLPVLHQIVEDLKVKRRDALDVLIQFKNNGEYTSNYQVTDPDEDIIETIQDNTYNPQILTEAKLMTEEVKKVLESFPERESEIIKKRYGFSGEDKETLQSLGDKYAISAEATRQIERKILALIRSKYPALAYFYHAA
jgi:RNA polymerase primary sigma factor